MARVKRAVNAQKKRRSVLEKASGYRGQRSRLYRKAKEQVTHSLVYSYNDRRKNKGNFRKLWIQRINAAARAEGIDASGPISADTLFHRAYVGAFDLVVAFDHAARARQELGLGGAAAPTPQPAPQPVPPTPRRPPPPAPPAPRQPTQPRPPASTPPSSAPTAAPPCCPRSARSSTSSAPARTSTTSPTP